MALESELRHALAAGQLDVFYQPIIRLVDRSVAGFEALLRWQHPVKGLVSPGDFIAHSEETGLIVELGRFALERAATDLAHWQRYFPLKPPLFVSVNFSRRQVKDTGFEALLRNRPVRQRHRAGQPASGDHRNRHRVRRQDAADHGAYPRRRRRAFDRRFRHRRQSRSASCATCRSDTVKIDKSFLARHGGTDIDTDGEVVLSGIVAMAHELRRAVVAEGVESEADAQFLAKIGCEFGQGYYFSHPLEGAAALDYIARHYNTAAAEPPIFGSTRRLSE